MSWLYSRALVAGYLGGNCLDGAQFALWSGTNTPQPLSPKDKTMGPWKLSRYGMTYKPLTDDLGETVLMSYLADSRAKTSALQEKEQESTEKEAECGGTWRELSARFDRATCSWKTHQCLFTEDLPESSVTFPKWGMIRDGVLWEQTTPERRTVESESGFWPTPCLPGNGGSHGKAKLKAMLWPTPTAHNGNEMDSPAEKLRHTPSLTHQARGGDTTQPKRLNPEWVEWLMGWPIGWTDLKPLATARSQAWLRSHGES
jgi:hypothetical protein